MVGKKRDVVQGCKICCGDNLCNTNTCKPLAGTLYARTFTVCGYVLKLPFRSQLTNFLNKIFKKLAYIYYIKWFLWRNLCRV